jgi:hypothetical protein
MKKLLKIPLVTLAIFASILFLAFSWHVWETKYYVPSGEGSWQEESPDGRFTMTGYLTKGLLSFVSVMPGQGSDGDGVVVLRDKQTGKIIQTARVEQVSAISGGGVRWRDNYVLIVGVDDEWSLPPATDTKP